MKVTLTSITQPLTDASPGIKMSAEDLIVYCARVSNPKNQANTLTAPKLINYLIKHKHWSPFEMADLCFEIETSRAISAQILRHKSAYFQEFSLRYAEALGIEDIELRMQAETNRQSSTDLFGGISHKNRRKTLHIRHSGCDDEDLLTEGLELLLKTEAYYDRLVKRGIAKECARMFLPLATTSRLYMKAPVRTWIHFFQARLHETAQKEVRLIAQEIFKVFRVEFPNITEALLESGQIDVSLDK